MSTLPAEIVRLGSIYEVVAFSDRLIEDTRDVAYHNCNKRVLELLIGHLGVDIDTRKPATISWMRVIPSDGVLQPLYL